MAGVRDIDPSYVGLVALAQVFREARNSAASGSDLPFFVRLFSLRHGGRRRRPACPARLEIGAARPCGCTGQVARHSGKDMGIQALNGLQAGELTALLGNDPLVLQAAQISYRHIAFLDWEIRKIEKEVEPRVKLTPHYKRLTNVPGIGRVLSMTIMLETGPIARFPGPGNYAYSSRLRGMRVQASAWNVRTR